MGRGRLDTEGLFSRPSWGLIMRTRNGGASWGTEYRASFALRSVSFLSANVGWAAGDGVIKTTDGGKSWVTEPGAPSDLQSVDFVDATDGWAVGGTDSYYTGGFSRVIVHTSNGGATWQVQYATKPRRGVLCRLRSSTS